MLQEMRSLNEDRGDIPEYGPGKPPGEGPVYWMNETTGELKSIIERFLKDIELNLPELKKLRWYVYQWVKGMPKKPHGYESILKMSQLDLKRYCYTTLLDYNIDPF